MARLSGTISELINYNNNIPYICFYDTIANTFYFLLVGFDDSDLWDIERLWLTHGKHFALAIDNERNIFTGSFDLNKKELYDCVKFGTVLPPEEVNNEK